MSVYVAGSSDELDRARRVMDRYRAAGVEVVSTWVEGVTTVGAGNPRDATREQRQAWAYPCIDQVRAADVLHMLAPSIGHGRGAYFELALAFVWSKLIVASGDTKQSIFAALVHEDATDDAAIALVADWHQRAGKLIPGTPIDAWGKVIVRSRHARPIERRDEPLVLDHARFLGHPCHCPECEAKLDAEVDEVFPRPPAHVEPERSTAMRVATDEESGDV